MRIPPLLLLTLLLYGLSSSPYVPCLAAQTLVQVTVDAGQERGAISRYLTGFNSLMAHVTDDVRADGRLTGWLRDVRAGILRFPGGEVTDRYHWEEPGFPKFRDAWNPEHADHARHSEYMDTDEFIAWCTEVGAEPMIGINVESGVKLDRVQDGVDEAVRWVLYCKNKGYGVTWWFLGNESSYKSTYHQLTVEQYGELIVRFGRAMREVAPGIRFIINWDPNPGNPDKWAEYETLFRIAGEYINVCDVHRYWSWNSATYGKWLNQNPMGRDNMSYAEETALFYRKVRALNLDIKMAVLEWSRGPQGDVPQEQRMSAFATGLVNAEMLGQFINSGVYMACYWPMNWPDVNNQNRNRHFWVPGTERPLPVYDFMRHYVPVLGEILIGAASTDSRLYPVAAKSRDGNTMWVYMVNKSVEGERRNVNLTIDGFTASDVEASAVTAESVSVDEARVETVEIRRSPSGWELILPPHSLTRVTFKQ